MRKVHRSRTGSLRMTVLYQYFDTLLNYFVAYNKSCILPWRLLAEGYPDRLGCITTPLFLPTAHPNQRTTHKKQQLPSIPLSFPVYFQIILLHHSSRCRPNQSSRCLPVLVKSGIGSGRQLAYQRSPIPHQALHGMPPQRDSICKNIFWAIIEPSLANPIFLSAPPGELDNPTHSPMTVSP